MAIPAAAGLLGSIAPGLATSAAQGLSGWLGAKRQRKFQREMVQTQYKQDLEMWNRQNLYNSPAEQRKRLEDAGLNPALMYGSPPQNVSSTLPKYGSAETPTYTFDPTNIMDMLGKYIGIKAGMEDVKTKNLSNQYLDMKLQQEQLLRYIQGTKGYIDIGEGKVNNPMDSFYGRKSQAEVTKAIQENELRNFQIKFMKNIPKEMQWMGPLIMNVIKMVK